MRLARFAAVVVLAAAFLAGCNKSVVGKWEARSSSGLVTMSLVFNKDKTGVLSMTPDKTKIAAMAKETRIDTDAKSLVLPVVWDQDGDKVTVRSRDAAAVATGNDSFTIEMLDSKTLVSRDPAGNYPPTTYTRK